MNWTVAVRALCDFTAREGDLDLRFTPGPSAEDGMAGHLLVAGRRPPHYQTEISLCADYGSLQVRGRADGYDAQCQQLEEIKTFRGDLAHIPHNQRQLHRAQARVYAWLLCRKLGLQQLKVALVYLNIDSGAETTLVEENTAAELQAFFEGLCLAYLQWAEREERHRRQRQQALVGLQFPHATFRSGQRVLAEAVYKVSSTGQALLAQAPTGIGKTMATLFPMLKAMGNGPLDKIFFLTAKTPGRQQAVDALASLPRAGLRVLELVARETACEHRDKACHGSSCPLAQGFYDRLPAARSAAATSADFGRAALRTLALQHGICPYYLQQELVRWSDVVIGDYNYYFDSHALLYSLTQAQQWHIGLLVDEAHNLVERGRSMYTVQLDQHALREARKAAPPSLRRAFDRVSRHWKAVNSAATASYQVLPSIPDKLLAALQQLIPPLTDHLAQQPATLDSRVMNFYFDALQFCRLAERFDSHTLCDVTSSEGAPGALRGSLLSLRNIVPAPFIGPRLQAAHAAVLFSATLSPWFYYSDLLGLPAGAAWLDVESPFRPSQLAVRVAQDISTRFQHRQQSLPLLLDVMARHYRSQPGNYLAFFSSFDYLQQACTRFMQHYPDIAVWQQSRQMHDSAREAFLARFEPGGSGVGFAVLGGAFGEGIDLTGTRLIGAFIATLGLPQINPVNEEIRQRMQALFGSGYDYTYLYPGLQKVVQAAGRVIRAESDHGAVWLLDDRFARAEVRQLLPAWWDVHTQRTDRL